MKNEKNENPALSKMAVSGSILIHNGSKTNAYCISSKHSIFKNEYIKVDVDTENCVLFFSVPTLDYKGKMYKTRKHSSSKEWRHFTYCIEFIYTGKFQICEEESDEDVVVVYYC